MCEHAGTLVGWLVVGLMIDWLFMHDLEERCDVRASNIEFARCCGYARVSQPIANGLRLVR